MSLARRLSDWSKEQLSRMKHLRGEPRLAAMWGIAQQLAGEGKVDEQIVWLKGIMKWASSDARIDFTVQAFGELRRIYEADPRYADLRNDVLWYYKWLLENLPSYADVPLATIEQIFGEMEAFYQSCRESLRPIFGLRCHAAILTGHKADAADWYEKWLTAARGQSDDCAACETDLKVAYLLYAERPDDAIEAGEPVLRGKQWCNETPRTLTRLVAPLQAAKRGRQALVVLKASERGVRREPKMLSPLSSHAVLWLLSGNLVRSRRVALMTLRRAKAATSDVDRYAAYRSCGLWAAFATLAGEHERTIPRRLLPNDNVTDAPATGDAPLPEVAAACFAGAGVFAEKLDTRNGTDKYREQLRQIEATIAKAAKRLTPRDRGEQT